jgi:hypothetical protein
MLFVVCVIIHYEGLHALTCWDSLAVIRPRRRIMIIICAQFFLHLIEICIFAAGFFLLADVPEYGALLSVVDSEFSSIPPGHYGDYFYFSAVVYTTLGMGEIVPVGPVRILAGMEAIGGLLLIAWSASFTFIEMQRHWRSN